jgi:hypothetical protein
MSQDRNLKLLNNNRIVYRRDPITDKPDEVHDWGVVYYNGTHECYELFRTRAKITTYKSLKWHLLVLWYLNPQLDQDKFEYIARHIVNKANGFVTFNVSEQLFKNIIYDVSMYDLEYPPKNKLRKVIFNDTCGLEVSEKLSIVGSIIGRSKAVAADDIYDAMLTLNEAKQTITVKKLASYFDCSTRTIYRNMTQELKKEKELLNSQL